MGYNWITNFMESVIGIIFCLSVCLAVWLAVWLSSNLWTSFTAHVEILGPQGPYKGPQRGPFLAKITLRLGLLRSFQFFESAALLLNLFLKFNAASTLKKLMKTFSFQFFRYLMSFNSKMIHAPRQHQEQGLTNNIIEEERSHFVSPLYFSGSGNKVGTCFTSSECDSRGGQSQGNCAAG